MDFKKLISHIESIDGKIETYQAPTIADPIQLDEDTELRVLAGVTELSESIIAEKAVSKAQQKAAGAALSAKRGDTPKSELKDASKEMLDMSEKELEKIAGTKHKGLPEKKTDESVEVSEDEMKVGDTKKTSTGGTLTKTATGVKHRAKDWDGEDHTEPAQKKASKASMTGAERREQKAADKAQDQDSKDWEKRFGKGSVTRHKMKDDVEIDSSKFLDKFMGMVKEAKKSKPMKEGEKKMKGKKAEEKMDEASKPDFLDIDKDGDKKEPMKKAAKEAGKGQKKDDKKGMTEKQKKYFGKKDESVKSTKKVVAESVEPNMSFREMMKLVVESGGQQQIDPLDKALFDWATRVAKQKLGEGMKAEVYAGMIYERMGGRFEMYDVLAEDQK